MRLNYEQLKNLKIGGIYYDSTQRSNIKFTVKTEPIEEVKGDLTQISFIGSVKGQDDIRFLMTKGLEHYGPNIYEFPAYVGVKNIGF